MKKQFAKLPLIACVLMTVFAAGQAWAKAEFVMKIGTGSTVRDYWSFTWTPKVVFEQEVERRSKGRIDVKWYNNNQLGSIEQVVIQTKQGLVQGAAPEAGHYATLYPNIQLFSIPYLFIDRQVAWEVMNGKVARHMMDDMAEKLGIRPLAFYENGGFRNYTNSKRPLRTAADLKGLKIRTMNNPLHMEIVRNLGASPTPISWKELYSALQTGVVDGQENSVPTFRVPKLEEVQKYMILDGHVYSFTTIMVNEKWLRSLPQELQQAVFQAGAVCRTVHNGLCILEEQKDIDELRKKGLDIYAPPLEVKEEFRKLTQAPAIEWLRKQDGIDGKLLDELLAEVDSVEKKFGYK